MIYSHVIAAVLAAALSAAGTWKVADVVHQGDLRKYDAKIAGMEKQQQEDILTAVKDSAKVEKERYERNIKQILDSEYKARAREVEQRRAAASARAESDSLRDNLAAIKSGIPGLTATAARQYTATLSGLLGDCTGRYTEMGATAQGHANDVRTLIERWPKE